MDILGWIAVGLMVLWALFYLGKQLYTGELEND